MTKRLTNDDFICRAKEVHGDKYDYSKVEYVNSRTKVCIICPEHGEFLQTPTNHFLGKGCPVCAHISTWDKRGRITTEEFIRKAKDVHGNRYDYSKTIYKGFNQKVIITCKEHGDFLTLPNSHVRLGCNCPECAETIKWSKELLEKRGREKYGDRFDYSLSEISSGKDKAKIKCNACGTIFETTPKNHIISRGGCPTCRHKFTAESEGVSFDEFVKRATAKHGNKYQYHKDCYTFLKNKTKITCPIHGVFWQTAMIHLNCGCKLCANEKVAKMQELDTETFIERSIETHGNKYDYSLSKYVDWKTKIKIICRKHGVFEQTPYNHSISGRGCPLCKISSGESIIMNFLKTKNIEFVFQYKIQNIDLFCSNTRLFVDFYLPKHNVIIEFNGMQHYKPIKLWGGQESFEKQQNRDISVKMYCKENNIKLIEIPTKKFGKIKEILTKELKIKVKTKK